MKYRYKLIKYQWSGAAEVELVEDRLVDAFGGHEDDCEVLCVWDNDFYGMLKVEFGVDGLDVELLESFNGSKDSYMSVLFLIVNIFDDKTDVSFDVMVRAYVFTNLR